MRISKSRWKCKSLLVNHLLFNQNNEYPRSKIITLPLYQQKVFVHNGQTLCSFFIKKTMIGHKFGEFAITKILGSEMALRKKNKNKKKNKKKK